MPRIVGVDIPNDKSIWIALTYIVGIGKRTSGQILKEAGIEKDMKANKLTEDELSNITQIIDRNYIVEGQLRRQVSQNIGSSGFILFFQSVLKNVPDTRERMISHGVFTC